MNTGLLKSYIKQSYKSWLIVIPLIILLYRDVSGSMVFDIFFLALVIVQNGLRFKEQLEKIKKLKARGLTVEDVSNIAFVKKWDETRKGGIWSYCIKDGGILTGALLSVFISLLVFIITRKNITQMFPAPGKMFAFIAYTYLTGALIGVISYRIAWTFNERRFLRLTDPINTIFTDKKESFDDFV